LRLVVAEMGEAHRSEQGGERVRIGAGELDELETVKAERIVVDCHAAPTMTLVDPI
ncbi:MAG: hypothetical protein QOH81_275, partial [Sphingomonadales bacterium]|nr:hypothetical protein [Sphingomonadales bacterium]